MGFSFLLFLVQIIVFWFKQVFIEHVVELNNLCKNTLRLRSVKSIC
jgi:hypothetical protein